MKTITVKQNQSMPDVILMACGTLEAGMAFCALNGVAISDIPAVNTIYKVPDLPAETVRVGASMLTYINQNKIVIGTLSTDTPITGYVTEDEGDYYTTEDGDVLTTEN